MLYLGVLKRVLPFVLTFAAGLFIASFFINIAWPSFNMPRRANKCRETRQLRIELEQVKRENAELQRQIEKMTAIGDADLSGFEFNVPPPPPPPAPRVHFHPRFEK